MAWLRFRMDLQKSDSLVLGELAIMDGTKAVQTFVATSGLPRFQTKANQSTRARGPLPSCSKLGISSYSVRTTPFDLTNKSGVEGNFYYIEPDPVTVDGVKRGEFGVHFDANVPGSAGCVVLRDRSDWKDFQLFMKNYKQKGFTTIGLIVEYNKPASTQPTNLSLQTGLTFFTVAEPKTGAILKVNETIQFSGTAKSEVATVIATIGPGGPFKIGEVEPGSNQWSFPQVLMTPGINRPVTLRALDENGDFLQDIELSITLKD